MKKNIHPNYGPIIITMPNGDTFNANSAVQNNVLVDIDFRKHSAWTGGVSVANTSSNQISGFNKKFGGMFSAPQAAQ